MAGRPTVTRLAPAPVGPRPGGLERGEAGE